MDTVFKAFNFGLLKDSLLENDYLSANPVLPEILFWLNDEDIVKCRRVNRRFYYTINNMPERYSRRPANLFITGLRTRETDPESDTVSIECETIHGAHNENRILWVTVEPNSVCFEGTHAKLFYESFTRNQETREFEPLNEPQISTDNFLKFASVDALAELRRIFGFLLPRLELKKIALEERTSAIAIPNSYPLVYWSWRLDYLECIRESLKSSKAETLIMRAISDVHVGISNESELERVHLQLEDVASVETEYLLQLRTDFPSGLFIAIGKMGDKSDFIEGFEMLLQEWIAGTRAITRIELDDVHRNSGFGYMLMGIPEYDYTRSIDNHGSSKSIGVIRRDLDDAMLTVELEEWRWSLRLIIQLSTS